MSSAKKRRAIRRGKPAWESPSARARRIIEDGVDQAEADDASYVAFLHPSMEADIRALPGIDIRTLVRVPKS